MNEAFLVLVVGEWDVGDDGRGWNNAVGWIKINAWLKESFQIKKLQGALQGRRVAISETNY